MFKIELQVRDYECDIQGIVNNGVYNNYFEHARHQFFQKRGLNFLEITKSGISLVIYRSEIDYIVGPEIFIRPNKAVLVLNNSVSS